MIMSARGRQVCILCAVSCPVKIVKAGSRKKKSIAEMQGKFVEPGKGEDEWF